MKILLVLLLLIPVVALADDPPPRAPLAGGQSIQQEITRMNESTEKTRWQNLRARFLRWCGDLCP